MIGLGALILRDLLKKKNTICKALPVKMTKLKKRRYS